MSVGWYLKRLASMSVPEILHRVGEQAKRSVARRRVFGWSAFAGHTVATLPLAPLRAALLEQATPALRERIAGEARAVLAGEFAALGMAWPPRAPGDLFPASLWTLDPATGRHWPGADRFCFDIPYRHERQLGDVKFVWEINRLQFLQPLAAHFALSGDPASLAALEAAIASWHAANPPFRGLGWNSGIELALRAVSLLLVLAFAGEALGVKTRSMISEMLAAHHFWLARYPSRFSSANNHLIAELMALFALALVMPGLPGAARLRDKAAGELAREARLQILADGVPAEQSPTYGAFSAEMLLTAALMGRAAGVPLAPVVAERLALFADYIGWIASPDGSVPAIGDDDEGRVLTLNAMREAAYPASVARAIAGFMGQAEARAATSQVELRDALFASPEAVAVAPGIGTCFEAGGYSVIRDRIGGRKAHLLVDHGPLGYLSIAAHGHADVGSFTLSLDDAPLFVDPGTYLYHSGGAWRDWFRGTRAHSTLALEGENQSTISGAFNWSHKAGAKGGLEAGEGRWAVVAEHDGYHTRFGVNHRRRFAPRVDGIEISDTLIGNLQGNPVAEVIFQCAPGVSAEVRGDGFHLSRAEAWLATLQFSKTGELHAECGGEGEAGGWVSPCFGTKIPAFRLSWKGSLGPEGLVTTLIWRETENHD